MRQKTLCMIISILMFLPAVCLAGKKPSGEMIGDTLFHDLKYDYDLRIGDGWKVGKIKQDKDIYRLAIAKISPVMPDKYNASPSLFTQPMMVVLVDTNMVDIDSLEVLIRERDDKIDIIKKALSYVNLLTFSDYRPDFDRTMKHFTKGFEGRVIKGKKRIWEDIYIRSKIYILQNDKYTFLIEAAADLDRFGFNEKDFDNMVNSIVFRADQPETKKIEEKE